MNLLSRIYIINDVSDSSHMCTLQFALVTVGYNFNLLVVQGIRCVINYFFFTKKETYA